MVTGGDNQDDEEMDLRKKAYMSSEDERLNTKKDDIDCNCGQHRSN